MKRYVPSARELEILYGYATGLTDRVIAKTLDVNANYVSVLGARMRARMGANTRSHAVAIAYELGILTVGSVR